MLNVKCYENSYVGLFKIIKVDREERYVYYQDVFTNKKFKIIDISMSSTLAIDNKLKVTHNHTYGYNR